MTLIQDKTRVPDTIDEGQASEMVYYNRLVLHSQQLYKLPIGCVIGAL